VRGTESIFAVALVPIGVIFVRRREPIVVPVLGQGRPCRPGDQRVRSYPNSGRIHQVLHSGFRLSAPWSSASLARSLDHIADPAPSAPFFGLFGGVQKGSSSSAFSALGNATVLETAAGVLQTSVC